MKKLNKYIYNITDFDNLFINLPNVNILINRNDKISLVYYNTKNNLKVHVNNNSLFIRNDFSFLKILEINNCVSSKIKLSLPIHLLKRVHIISKNSNIFLNNMHVRYINIISYNSKINFLNSYLKKCCFKLSSSYLNMNYLKAKLLYLNIINKGLVNFNNCTFLFISNINFSSGILNIYNSLCKDAHFNLKNVDVHIFELKIYGNFRLSTIRGNLILMNITAWSFTVAQICGNDIFVPKELNYTPRNFKNYYGATFINSAGKIYVKNLIEISK